MNQYILHSRRVRSLLKGNLRKVGVWEGLWLRIAGRHDGALGLPREGADGRWTSAFVDHEVNGYAEFCSHMWALLQMENERDYARLNELTVSIPLTRARLDEVGTALEAARQEAQAAARKAGEDALTDDQVHARRAREQEKALLPLQEKLLALQTQLETETDEFFRTNSRLEENGNTIRMSIHRLREHVLQRLDVYWNAAMAVHPKGAAMPVVPAAALPLCDGEDYSRLHKHLTETAARMQLRAKEAV